MQVNLGSITVTNEEAAALGERLHGRKRPASRDDVRSWALLEISNRLHAARSPQAQPAAASAPAAAPVVAVGDQKDVVWLQALQRAVYGALSEILAFVEEVNPELDALGDSILEYLRPVAGMAGIDPASLPRRADDESPDPAP